VNNHQKRLKEIEVSLTPYQLVLLWVEATTKGTYAEGAVQSPRPRCRIANSVAGIVRTELKGQSEDLIERAILQARKEADFLYMMVVELKGDVLRQSVARDREYKFLLGYLHAVMHSSIMSDSEMRLRKFTLSFVEQIFCLDEAISQIRSQRFGGSFILFSDCAAKLKDQLEMATDVLEVFNIIANDLQVPVLTKEQICETLQEEVRQQVSRREIEAWVATLGTFGTEAEFRESLAPLSALLPAHKRTTRGQADSDARR
jgi:hypothetical protein